MSGPTILADLEERLARTRVSKPATDAELGALVALAARMVPDPTRRGELAREGLALARRLGDQAAALRCRAMIAESVARSTHPADALPDALAVLAEAERL